MMPAVAALTLAFLSFFASGFVILRIIIPILPPHPLSKRVAPAEFGLPNFRKLSPADKAHVWLASLDMVALAIFVWQVVNEARGGPSGLASASDMTSSIRLWTILTIRQTMLLVIVVLTLLHVRLGRPISFGRKHWVLWAPSLVLVITSTAMTGIFSSIGVRSLFFGLIAYSSAVTAITLTSFTFLLTTLLVIKRNLNAINEEMDSWPPVRETLEKPRPSFSTEDIDALRETGSWISSNSSTSSCSISAWSFSTQHSAHPSSNGHGRPQTGGHHSVPAKSAYWFGADSQEEIPPVPPLPLPYSRASPCIADLDPFRMDTPRPRLGSQTSWLTSSDGSHSTMSAWSFPTTTKNEPSTYTSSMRDYHTSSTLVSQSINPALGGAQVLGGYGFNPSQAEKAVPLCSSPPSSTLDVSLIRNVGWFLFILIPYTFSLPYLIIVSQNHTCPLVVSTFFMLSILLSSPILAFNIIFRCPFPIPTGLFDASSQLSPALGLPKPENCITRSGSFEPKRSVTASITVVEGSRSGDVWIAQGDAVDGKGKLGRAIEVLNPCPKLSVIPPPKECIDEPVAPPLPMRNEFSLSKNKQKSAENDRRKTESNASSHLSGDECLAITSKIMIAQRHYSTLAQTVILPSTPPEKGEVMATGATTKRASGHLRSRSTTSVNGPSTPTPTASFKTSPTPPPPFPLPPTPPSVRRALAITHKKSFSSGFSFNRPDDVTEVEAMTAGVFPLFVRSLKVGDDAKSTDEYSICSSYSRNSGTKGLKKVNGLWLDSFSPHIASTPARELRNKKSGQHQKHYSLPSLGLGKGGIHSPSVWSAHTRGAIEDKVACYKYSTIPSNVEVRRRNTILGAESVPNTNPLIQIQEHLEDQDDVNFLNPFGEADFSRATSSCTLRVDICGELDHARNSLIGSAASTVTLFENDDTDFASGPVAESTPHNSFTEKEAHRQPLSPRKHTHKRSGIVYTKSEKPMDDGVTPPDAGFATAPTMTRWPSLAMKPLAPKVNKLQRKVSNVSSILTGVKSDLHKASLRPLTLLQNRGANAAISSTTMNETRPLSFGKKQKQPKAVRENADENSDPNISPGSHRRKLKPLKLARSETSKIRGILRQTEVLPQVVVRPPSETEHGGFEYNLHCH